MTSERNLRLDAIGACGSGGSTLLRLSMCVRASKLKPVPSRFMDAAGERIAVHRVGFLPEEMVGYERLVRLAKRAFYQDVGDRLPFWASVPVVVSLPEAGRPDDDARYGGQFLRDLADQNDLLMNVERSRCIRKGHAGFAFALEEGISLLSSDAATEAVVVGGVDSYYHPEVIRWLDAERRLHKKRQSDGFIPGEGAAFLLLRRSRSSAKGADPTPAIQLRHVATGLERSVEDGTPNLALEMTRVVKEAIAAAGGAVDWVIGDVNGEAHRVSEWSKAMFRTTLKASTVSSDLVREVGDVGAASGALFAAVAGTFWQLGCEPRRSLLLALHSEGSERGAILMEKAA